MSAKLTLTIHGLDADNKLVRAEVFAQKFGAMLRGLKLSDEFVNGKKLHEFIIEDLTKSSARVQLREKQKNLERPGASSVEAYHTVAKAIYDGQSTVRNFPKNLLSTFATLSKGTEKSFQHAELNFESDSIIRIDDYMFRQSERAIADIKVDSDMSKRGYFRGVSIATFDGTLRVIDSRGELLRAKLITTAGEKEIDCIVKKDRVQEFSSNFDHRVRLEGTAHYDGTQALPIRVDVNQIRPVRESADLTKWRGAFRGSAALKEDW